MSLAGRFLAALLGWFVADSMVMSVPVSEVRAALLEAPNCAAATEELLG